MNAAAIDRFGGPETLSAADQREPSTVIDERGHVLGKIVLQIS